MKKSMIVFAATVFAVTTTPALANMGSKKTTTSQNVESPMSEAKVAQELRESISRDASLSSKAKSLRVSSSNGSVTVTGTVASEAEKSRVESMAQQAAGEKVVMDVAVE